MLEKYISLNKKWKRKSSHCICTGAVWNTLSMPYTLSTDCCTNFMEIWDWFYVLEKPQLGTQPRKLADNLIIFSELLEFIFIRIGLIGSVIRCSTYINFHNQMNQLLSRPSLYLDKVMWSENSWSEFTLNGLPIKYNWM